MALTGGVWSTLGLAVSVWIPDKWITVSLPTFVYFVLNSRTIYLITGIRIPHAAYLYNDALTIPIVLQSLSYDALLMLVFTLIYMVGVKWRAMYG